MRAPVTPELPDGTATMLFTDIEGSSALLHRVALGLARLGRDEDAAVVIGVCEIAHRELSTGGLAWTTAVAAGPPPATGTLVG